MQNYQRNTPLPLIAISPLSQNTTASPRELELCRTSAPEMSSLVFCSKCGKNETETTEFTNKDGSTIRNEM